MLRSVDESTVCVASVSASATPIEAVPPCVSPCAIVVAEAVSDAFASRLPPMLSAVPVPIEAELFTFEITTAMPGAIATFGDEAPIFACVPIACRPSATIVRLWPPVRVAPLSIDAAVVSLTIASAKEAPTPTLAPPAPVFAISAFVVLELFDAAPSATSPVPALTTPPLRMPPVVSMVTKLSATEPATPT